jgi:dipeptidyl aminopeptidase/acylaminoacyl peptidase
MKFSVAFVALFSLPTALLAIPSSTPKHQLSSHTPKDKHQLPFLMQEDAKKRPFTPMDMVQLDRLGSVQVDPTGKRAVFTRWHYNVQTDKKSKSLWLLDLEKSPKDAEKVEALTEAVEGVTDDEPVWINDQELVFLRTAANGKRKGPQLFQVSLKKGKKVQELFPEHPLPMEIANLKYQPEGNYLTFTAEVYASGQSSLEGNKKRNMRLSIMENLFRYRKA